MVDDSKAFKPVGANRDPTPLVLAFHSSRGDSSTIPIPLSLILYSSFSFLGSLSLENHRQAAG